MSCESNHDPRFLTTGQYLQKGILSINDLLSESGNILTFHEFRDEYSCKFNFLQHYQIVSTIPKHLWSRAKGSNTINKSFFTRNDFFSFNESTKLMCTRLSQRTSIIFLTLRFTPKIKRAINVGAKNFLQRKTYGLGPLNH